jgi:hypothetical protein
MNNTFEGKAPLISYKQNIISTSTGLTLIKGESGSGKGRLVMNMMVGFSGKEDGLGFEYKQCPQDKHVIYFNTEMSKYELRDRLGSVIAISGMAYDERLVVIDASEEEEKWKMLEEVMIDLPPHVVIIDQIGDFCDDINNMIEAKDTIEKVTKLLSKYNCGGIVIMHQNESAGANGKARGHVGSFLEQKVVCSLSISQLSNSYKIKSTKIRSGRSFDLETSFAEETKMLTLANPLTKLLAKEIKSQSKETWVTAIQMPCTKMEFYDQLKELAGIRSQVTAQKKLESLIERNIFAIDSLTKLIVRVDKKDDVI